MTPDDQIKRDATDATTSARTSQSARIAEASAAPTAEERMRALAEAVGPIVWMSAPDGSDDREAWRAYTGQTEAEVAGWGWLDAVHPDDRARVRQAWSDALANQSPLSLAMRLRRAEGDYRIMRSVVAPVHGVNGDVREWVGACIDVTDRFDLEGEQRRLLRLERSAHAEAQAVGARLRAVLDVLPHGVVIADADGTLIMLNKALQALWGEDAPLDIGIEDYLDYKAWWPATGERVTAEEWGMARALERHESVIAEEMEIETFDGQRKTILNSAVPVYDVSGACVGGVAVNVDITDRKRLEAELAQRLSELESAFGAITDALFVYDAEGRLVRMNAAARELLGISDDVTVEAVDVGALRARARRYNLRSGDGVALSEDQWVLRRILRGEVIPPGGAVDLLLTRLNGCDVRVSFTGAPIRDSAGAIIGAVSVGRDVTERRRLEDELRAANAQLATVSAALAQQAHGLETVNRRMDQFLGMANHELKTPLTSLSANLQLATRRLRRQIRAHEQSDAAATESTPQSRELESVAATLERAQGSARRMTRLVNELLDVSRIQTGRLEVHKELCDLVALTRGVIGEARHGRAGRAIRLEVEAPSVPVQADVDRISEVIDNYLSNAAKYSPAETPITVTLTLADDDGMACLAVRDEGQGISPEMQARIWNVFERLDSDAAQRTNGVNLGLGLHICKTIIELHGGRVGVESADGAGSTFWFTLPLTPATPTA